MNQESQIRMKFGPAENALRQQWQFLPRDFVETERGEVFAVVAEGIEEERVLCFLRYLTLENTNRARRLEKQSTDEAIGYMLGHRSDWIYHSASRDVSLHGIPLSAVHRHWRPTDFARATLGLHSQDAREAAGDARALLRELVELDSAIEIGVTGSVLLGVAGCSSDLDMTVYGIASFELAQHAARELVQRGVLQLPSSEQLIIAHSRRNCALAEQDYVWHESRKFNKFVYRQRLVDLSCVEAPSRIASASGKKIEHVKLVARVVDADRSYCHPAEYKIEHPDISYVLSFTPTYAGQAKAGEWIEVVGCVENSAAGKRIVIGTDREAEGQWIRVVPSK